MRRILILLPHNPGDVVMGLHVLDALRARHPGAAIDWVAGEEAEPLLHGHPGLDRVFVIPARRLRESRARGDWEEVLALTRELAAQLGAVPYDLSVNLFQDLFGALLHACARAETRRGYDLENLSQLRVQGRWWEHASAVPAARQENPWHMVDIWLRALGLEGSARPRAVVPAPVFPLPPLPAGCRGRIALQPGSAWRGKRWPLRHWAALAGMLAAEGWQILCTGAPEEAALGENLGLMLPAPLRGREEVVLNFAGRTTLPEAGALIAACDWLVTGDTVAMHLAAAHGVRTVALFGASNPVETGPYGDGHLVLQKTLERPDTLRFEEPSPDLEAIRPETVAEALRGGEVSGCYCWRTGWDPKLKMQVLVDARGGHHPFQVDPQRREEAMNRGGMPAEELRGEGMPKRLLAQLELCLKSLEPGMLRHLEQMEMQFGGETRDSVIWEAYRIGINGLPLADLRAYLRFRRERLLQALAESAALGGGPG